ncbi:MAG: type II secretion system GspH family protein [Clostridia bacterium]|nr:type II secretion system GspH family protein [Clostridia bacterium]
MINLLKSVKNNRKYKGELSMKKMLKNKKGFSLIELVIVIAILAVLAAVGITMFPRIAGQSRETADETQANRIKDAIAMYIAASGDMDLNNMNLMAQYTDNPGPGINVTRTAPITEDTAGAQELVATLQNIIFDPVGVLTTAPGTRQFGPYLEKKNAAANTVPDLIEGYAPQTNGMFGWDINVNATTGNVTVRAANAYNLTIDGN